MASSPFSRDLEQFVHDNIDSVEQMEVLFLLCCERSTEWTAQEIAAKLYVQPESVAARLLDLVNQGLCRVTDPSGPYYQYQPADNEQDRLVRELMNAYRTHHVAVIKLIFSKSPKHLRLFSEAFKWRKDE
ncbi:MAG TPA: hypothetical protein VFW40_14485 [Capsulimonadaceae bacterium]|nr:hypothetical protein [Capsulimonadaceae bacterium]